MLKKEYFSLSDEEINRRMCNHEKVMQQIVKRAQHILYLQIDNDHKQT